MLISVGSGRKQRLYGVINDGDRHAQEPDNRAALDAFFARKAEIDRMLERLTALSGDHFNVNLGEIDGGHSPTTPSF